MGNKIVLFINCIVTFTGVTMDGNDITTGLSQVFKVCDNPFSCNHVFSKARTNQPGSYSGFHYLKNTNLCILIDDICGHHTFSIEGELSPIFIFVIAIIFRTAW